jgi:crotonobetainyl-CoA:carnitine CoA-transferase CaiB-like acyl-CoA transferase
VKHSGLIWEVPVGTHSGKTFRTVGSPFSFSATPATLRRGVPRAGEHTAEVLGGPVDTFAAARGNG